MPRAGRRSPSDAHANGAPAYRADVDGLRAVAVVAVVAYHAFPRIVPGGFVGVDVFFVISGYLITSILVASHARGGFSFVEFYVRRAKRLFPSLLTVLLFVYAFGFSALLPEELAHLGKHVAAGAGFVSNLVLGLEAGYFDDAASRKPLLHLWSLGIEEQFYLFWPVIVALAWRRKGVLGPVTLALGFLSLALNLWLTPDFAAVAFYLPITRLWELLLGATIATTTIAARRRRDEEEEREEEGAVRKGARLRDLLAAGGVALIGVACFAFDARVSFPGWRALVPTVGAYLALAFGAGTSIDRNLLSRRALVAVGKISYPLYLWHWPLLSFLTILSPSASSWKARLLAVVASFVLAALTYHFIERPVRHATYRVRGALVLSLPLAVLGVLGLITAANGGFAKRVANGAQGSLTLTLRNGKASPVIATGCHLDRVEKPVPPPIWCYTDRREKARYALLGDSHAAALYPGLVVKSTGGNRWELDAIPGCELVTGGVYKTTHGEGKFDDMCRSAAADAVAAIGADADIRAVLLAIAYRDLDLNDYVADKPAAGATASKADLYLEGISSTIDALERAGKQVAFVVDNPEITQNPAACLIHRPLAIFDASEQCTLPRAAHERAIAGFRGILRRLERDHRIQVVDPTDAVYCDARQCSVTVGRDSLYAYTDHLSDVGNAKVADLVLSTLNWR